MTQAQLAARLGTTQSAIARLEAPSANPRLDTLARALSACGRELLIDARPGEANVDESLVASRLRLSPAERIKAFDRNYASLRQVALAGRRARGELA